MQYGDRIINGILSLICLEPCHSPTVPLVREEAYRAKQAWLAHIPGIPSNFFLIVDNEDVPDYYFSPPGLSSSVLYLLLSFSEGVFMDLCVCWSQQRNKIGTKLVKDDVSGHFDIYFIIHF